ncbi:hypothetical protein V1511DRAFT_275859 [Dipodascopsis uninucleata]
MQMSLQDISSAEIEEAQKGQETGVVFEKATRDSYNLQHWSLVSVDNSGPILEESQEPSRLVDGEPSILIPSEKAPKLAALFMICQYIPLVADTFLLNGQAVVPEYGFAPSWWDNELIFVPNLVNPALTQNEASRLHFLVEVQRFMAFLCSGLSKRQFCSIDNLAFAWSNCRETYQDISSANFDSDTIGYFLRTWSNVLNEYTTQLNLSPLNLNLFETCAAVDQASGENEVREERLVSFEVPISEDVLHLQKSLTGALDFLLWGEIADAYLKSVADVVVMTLRQESGLPGTGIDLPQEWYPDRYSKHFQQTMAGLNKRRQEISAEIERLKLLKSGIENYSSLSVKSLQESTISYLMATSTESSLDNNSNSLLCNQFKTALAYINSIHKRLDEKIEIFEQEILEIAEKFSEPPTDEDALKYPPFHKYTLVGVIVNENVYFRHRPHIETRTEHLLDSSSTEDSSMSTEVEEQTEVRIDNNIPDKWYYMAFYQGAQGRGSFEVKEVLIDQVIDTARSQGFDGVVAVYADERALSYSEKITIPEPLKLFLEEDNAQLDAEVISLESVSDLINLEAATTMTDTPCSSIIIENTASRNTEPYGVEEPIDNDEMEQPVSRSPVMSSEAARSSATSFEHREHAK